MMSEHPQMAGTLSAERRNRLGNRAIDAKLSDYDQRMTSEKVAPGTGTAPKNEKS
jgi:hypothetical protein